MLHIGLEVIRIEEMLALEPASALAEWRDNLLDAGPWTVPNYFHGKAGASVVSIRSWLVRTRFEHGD